VLDCANGYKKESKEEGYEVEEDYRREGEVDQKANEKSSGEGSKEEVCAGQSCGKEEKREERDQSKDCERE
jgi:hypothetical protein